MAKFTLDYGLNYLPITHPRKFHGYIVESDTTGNSTILVTTDPSDLPYITQFYIDNIRYTVHDVIAEN